MSSTTDATRSPQTLKFSIEGMTCGSCAGKVTGAVEPVEGVVDTDVDLATGMLTVTVSPDADRDEFRERVTSAIHAAGYRVA